jgi:NhaA family Na+:H+ antiporter
MSLFITSLAFTEELHLNQAKIGIFAASIIGSLSGYLLLRK